MVGWILVLVGLVCLTVLLHLTARLLRLSVAARFFGDMPWLPAEWSGPLPDGENVEFSTADGVRLRGTYLPRTAGGARGVILFCHELNGDRWNAVPYTRDLRHRGFDVFTFDFRNHGASDRVAGYEPMAWVSCRELMDVRAAIDYVASRGEAAALGIGLMGVSRGATAALCAAANEPRVRALVLDGIVPLERLQVFRMRRFLKERLHLPGFLHTAADRLVAVLVTWAKAIIGWRCGCRLADVERAIGDVRQPTLLIHGRHDPFVPLEVARWLREGMSDQAWLWVVPHARHGRAISAAPELYQRRSMYFFARYLASPAAADASHALAPHQPISPPARRARQAAAVVANRVAVKPDAEIIPASSLIAAPHHLRQ